VEPAEDPEGETAADGEDTGGMPRQPRAGLAVRSHQLPFRPPKRTPQRHCCFFPQIIVLFFCESKSTTQHTEE